MIYIENTMDRTAKSADYLGNVGLGQLPPYQSIFELRKWGDPKSPLRLRKMAYHIALLAKNFKKMPSRGYDDAITDWEDDLKYLYDQYYVRHFHFDWPSH